MPTYEAVILWQLRRDGLKALDERLMQMVREELGASAARTPISPAYVKEESCSDVIICGVHAAGNTDPKADPTVPQMLHRSPSYNGPPQDDPPPNSTPPNGPPMSEACGPDQAPQSAPEPATKRRKRKKHKRERPEDSSAPHSGRKKTKRHKGVLQRSCVPPPVHWVTPWLNICIGVQVRGRREKLARAPLGVCPLKRRKRSPRAK
jgi:hypothetical protein